MLPSIDLLRRQLKLTILAKEEQGHVVAGLDKELESLPASYDRLMDFAHKLLALPLRGDWPYVELSDLPGIWNECDPARPSGPIGEVADAAERVEAAFLGSVCGCVLGKPLEINPTMADIRKALAAVGEWPLNDYVSEHIAAHLPREMNGSWVETVRGRIRWVAPDDDINYTVLGMLMLEQHGVGFTREQLRDEWLRQLPIGMTFGPERVVLCRAGTQTLENTLPADFEGWTNLCNPRDERCGALIRADAYGYACPGRPALAAELAWRDASFTHRRTGIYGAMFIAAALACAPVVRDRLDIFEMALKFVPRRSRFHKIVRDSLNDVAQAKDWLDAYDRIHGKYWQYAHCRIYQEIGTLINTLRFAESIGDGLCKQVSQGNDTDSFGATAGSLLGLYFGPGHLEERWLKPFNDDLRTTLAQFYERSLSKVAKRMSKLPALTL